MLDGLFKKLTAIAVVAASALVATVALGFTVFYALSLVMTPLGAAAVTTGVFALICIVTALVFLGKGKDDHEDDEEPEGLAGKIIHIVRHRPVLGAAGGLGILFLLLRNPALAAIAASMITEKRAEKRYRRRW
ncbi:hypothetical protein E4M02_05715 [Brevundimonas sp. S30B]|uniref:hypothetical protein n=1 Tax=unclassified Brevundimonas TaxID=2622653 RepID=UPI0010716919|nr:MULTISPECIES: hypothetical protein [unclassified Brevundimonas]QBX36645.1 hypothetical protein E4M01_02100 [Brevundimonas sp. MF30-B]TFW04560.1 hypothetical protein E4M02_05715 [Brevundimonas sp. S30B]